MVAIVVQQGQPTDRSQGVRFVLLSLALHALLLLGWLPVERFEMGGERNAPIAITLLSNPAQPQPQRGDRQGRAQPEVAAAPPPKKRVDKGPQQRGRPANLATLSAVPQPISEGDITATEPYIDHPVGGGPIEEPNKGPLLGPAREPSGAGVATIKAAEQRLLSEIKVEFSRYFRYPPRALRRALEGKVVLSFRLDATGAIQNITITESSGHGILDRAAIASLTRITPLHGVPQSGLSFELPIIYKIHNG